MRTNHIRVFVSASASIETGTSKSASSIPAVCQHLLFHPTNAGVGAAWTYEIDGAGVSPGIIIPMSSERYNSLFYAIRRLASDDDLEDESVDMDTARDAAKVLAAIEARNLPAPQIFSHSGSAVVFSWDLPRVSRYLTVSHGSAAVLDIDRRTKTKNRYPSQTISDYKILNTIKALGAPHAATNPA